MTDEIEELEYELQEAKELLRKAQEDGHETLIKKAKREIFELERKLLDAHDELESSA